MKKKYQKPEVCVENFLLSEMIASCDYRITAQTSNNCATNVDENILMEGWKKLGLFSDSTCTVTVTSGTELIWEGTKLCYHTSTSASVFAS